MTIVNRKTREILVYDIVLDRLLQRIQNLVDNAPKAEFYFSDAFTVYSQICYDGVYRAFNNKSQTFTLESVNADLRHYIPPLHRKSRCFFVLLILFSLSLKFLFLLSINFLLLYFVSIILNTILLSPRFYPDSHCQLS